EAAAPFEQAAADLKRDGFVVVRSCVDGAALGALVEEYESRIVPQKPTCDVRREEYGQLGEDGLPRVVHIANICEMPSLAHLAADRSLLELASACLGGVGVRPILNAELFDKPPDGNTTTQTSPHQDNFYFRAQEPGVALWITLDKMDNDSGTVRYVQGSHLRGLRFHDWEGGSGFSKFITDFTDEDDDLSREVGHLDPGDVVVHHGLTIHYAPSSLTKDHRRRGLVVNYVAEHIAYTLADDLYKPALTFNVCEAGNLVAAVPKDWPERHSLAVASVMCALQVHGVIDQVYRAVRIDSDAGKLFVELAAPCMLRQAIIALVSSGHLVLGARAVGSMPLQLGSFEVPTAQPQAPPRTTTGNNNNSDSDNNNDSKHNNKNNNKNKNKNNGDSYNNNNNDSHDSKKGSLPDKHLGVWMLDPDAALPGGRRRDLAVRLQTLSGIYVDVRIPSSMDEMRLIDPTTTTTIDPDNCEDFQKLLAMSKSPVMSCRSSAGFLTSHGELEDIAVRQRCVEFHPFNGMADVGRMRWHEGEKRAWVEESTLAHSRRTESRQTWPGFAQGDVLLLVLLLVVVVLFTFLMCILFFEQV
ncbi:unnamed protein product, partial [Polarella glacialis]